MKNAIDSFRDHFNSVVEEVQGFAIFVRAKEFQETAIETLEGLLKECKQAKNAAIEQQFENEANAYLAFEFMANALAEEFRFYLALKADVPDSAWDHLVDAQSFATNALKSHAVASHLDGYIRRLHVLEELLFPKQIFLSSSFIVKKSECSVCGAEYGECRHVRGRPYMGRLCAEIVKEAELQEVSVVSDPADKHCRGLNYTENGITKNIFTQRIVTNEHPRSDGSEPAGTTRQHKPT